MRPPPPHAARALFSARDRLCLRTAPRRAYASSVCRPASASAPAPSPAPPPGNSTSDVISAELERVRSAIPPLVAPGSAGLARIARHVFAAPGKAVRPKVVLLVALATNPLADARPGHVPVDAALSHPHVLLDPMPEKTPSYYSTSLGSSGSEADTNADTNAEAEAGTPPSTIIYPAQRRLAEITEIIHVATLLHDDVIDGSPLRRGQPSAPAAFGNRRAIFAGNFLLGRASAALARLRHPAVVQLVATIMDHLVEGELMQLRAQRDQEQDEEQEQEQEQEQDSPSSRCSDLFDPHDLADLLADTYGLSPDPSVSGSSSSHAWAEEGPSRRHFEEYLHKTYLKTAALIAKSCLACTLLGGHGSQSYRDLDWLHAPHSSRDPDRPRAAAAAAAAAAGAGAGAGPTATGLPPTQVVQEAAYEYGKNLGIAFQLIDDVLDVRASQVEFGKPSHGADMRLGLATGPVLFAWRALAQEAGAATEAGAAAGANAAADKAALLGKLIGRKFQREGDVGQALELVGGTDGVARTAALARTFARRAERAVLVLPATRARAALVRLARDLLERAK